MKKLIELLEGADISEIIGSADKLITELAYDSRKCKNGSLFVALRGATADGHNFIKKALMSGADVILCEEVPHFEEDYPDATYILTKNSRQALAKISHNWFGTPTKDITVIGVTGTNGKTTITFLLKSLFESAGKKAGIIGTTGIYYGEKKLTQHIPRLSRLNFAPIWHK